MPLQSSNDCACQEGRGGGGGMLPRPSPAPFGGAAVALPAMQHHLFVVLVPGIKTVQRVESPASLMMNYPNGCGLLLNPLV